MINKPVSIVMPTLRIQALWICTLAALFYCYEYFLRVAPAVMANDLISTYHISQAGLGYLSACYYYAYTPLQVPVGWMMDRFGPRNILTVACGLCVIGTFLFGTSSLLPLAFLGRFLVGFGSAFAFVGFLKISRNWLPPTWYATMVGLCTFLGMVGAISGEIAMAYWVQSKGWQSTLLDSVYVGCLLTFLLWLFIRDTPHTPAIANQRLTKTPTIKILPTLLTLIKNYQLWLIGLIGCFTFLPLSSFAEMWAVPYLEVVGYSKTQAAQGSSLVFLGFGCGAPCWGLISDYWQSRRRPLFLGALLASICAATLIFAPHLTLFSVYLLLFSCGLFASAEVLVFAIGNDTATNHTSATTVSFINMLVMLGGAFLQPIIGKLLDVFQGTQQLNTSLLVSYQYALSILPICLLLASLLALFLKESYHQPK